MKAKESLAILLLLVGASILVLALVLSHQGTDEDASLVPIKSVDNLTKTPTSKPATPMVSKTTPSRETSNTKGKRKPLRAIRQNAISHGLRGVVMDSYNKPIPNAEVYVCEAFDVTNFIKLIAMGMRKPRRRFNKVLTGKNGVFLIQFDSNVNADLYVNHPGFRPYSRKNVHIPSKGINDLGIITLSKGLVLQGYVYAADTRAPIPGATVRLVNQGTTLFNAIPGQEDGKDVLTDPNGHFVFDTLEPGTFTFEAFKKGYAKETKSNITVAEGAEPQRMEFYLQKGLTIAGVIVDGDGKPVPDAKVEALSYNPQNPVNAFARSRKDGRFEIVGLKEGTYKLVANAQGYVEGHKNIARGGQKDIVIVLQRKGGVIVQVLGKHGRPVRNYTLELRRVFDQQKVYGRTSVPNVTVRNAKYGKYTLTGIEPGNTYVVLVEAKGYAMKFSDPFKVELGKPMPQILVRLTQGGTIKGRVIDTTGRPVAGARVVTMSNAYENSKFLQIFEPLIPRQHSRVETVTNSRGEFTLRMVMPETYQLMITHPEFPTTYQKNVKVEEGQITRVPDIKLPIGVIVYGTAYDPSGRPIKGGKVTMQGDQGLRFGAEAITDENGRFQFPPAPPGTYKLQCGRVQGNNPFLLIVDFKKSETSITLTGATKRVRVNLQIRS